jgi:serpin B
MERSVSRWAAAVLAVATIGGLASGAAGAAERPDAAAAAVEAGNKFATDLYARLAKEKGNLFLSPHSIHVALAMTWAGARSETAAEMARVLRLEGGRDFHASFAALLDKLNSGAKNPRGDENYQLSVANALWGQGGYPFRKEFVDLVKARYGGNLEAVDFVGAAEAARLKINGWVEEKTAGKIKDLIPPGILDALTRLVLTNAIYMKSGWAEKFAKESTKEESFRLAAGGTVTVPLMRQVDRFGYMEGDGFQAVELPYAWRALSMVVLLPREPGGLPALERKLATGGLPGWIKVLKERKVDVALPRWKTTAEFQLGDVLKAMGMERAFDEKRADFSGMADLKEAMERLFIKAVIHKAFVSVDEEGTEAAAATAVVVAATGVPRPEEPVIFRADRPFLYLIRHRATGAILFLGRLADPR